MVPQYQTGDLLFVDCDMHNHRWIEEQVEEIKIQCHTMYIHYTGNMHIYIA